MSPLTKTPPPTQRTPLGSPVRTLRGAGAGRAWVVRAAGLALMALASATAGATAQTTATAGAATHETATREAATREVATREAATQQAATQETPDAPANSAEEYLARTVSGLRRSARVRPAPR